jgi:uncharacterized protein with von Willebrand factor type A (vWA) domain
MDSEEEENEIASVSKNKNPRMRVIYKVFLCVVWIFFIEEMADEAAEEMADEAAEEMADEAAEEIADEAAEEMADETAEDGLFWELIA